MSIDDPVTNRPREPPMAEPLAFFLTWTTYGTWLPGDDRGWVERGRGFQLPDPIRKREAEARLTDDGCLLDEEQRRVVEKTITDHCRIRGWQLHIVNCRTNHVHLVLTADREPEDVRDQFKAWCTRRLKELERTRGRPETAIRQKWWTEKGSQRRLWHEASLEAAIRYVRDGQ
jgi:REP element-mobilizing transposase RayT